jgi:hypothetical protein
MEFLRKLGSYLNFFKKQEHAEGQEGNFNLRAMHTINKISLAMFLGAAVFLICKWVIF